MKLLDLFSGIGGFSLGAEYNNIKTVGFVEKDAFCQKVLRKHWPNTPIIGNIRDVTKDTFESVDIVSGGFPCQPFSVAGKRRGTDDDRYLWDETIRVVSLYKPRWFVGENVEGIVNIQNGMVLRQVQDDLEKEGFEVQCGIIPASGIGAWHQRKRVWIIGHNVSHTNNNGYKRGQSETRNKIDARENNTSIWRESASNISRPSDDRGDKTKSRIDKDISRPHNGNEEKPTTTKGFCKLSEKSNECDTINQTSADKENNNRTLVQKRQMFQLSKCGKLGDDKTLFERNQIQSRNDNVISDRMDTNNVSNSHANLRRRRGAILQSGKNKIWGFYNEKSEQTSHDLRSETIRCDVVSGEKEDVSNSQNRSREQTQWQGRESTGRGSDDRSRVEREGKKIKTDVSDYSTKRLQRHNSEQQLSKEKLRFSASKDDERKQSWWEIESSVCTVPNGVSYELDKNRVNQIKSLGNSIVPQIAYQIFYAIISAEGKNRG